MSERVPFSAGWEFLPDGSERWERVDLPHSMVETPLNHFDERCLQITGRYAKTFTPPRIPAGGRLFLAFEGVAVSCRAFLNGLPLGGHEGPYTPFEIELPADALREGENRFELLVDATEDPEIPPFGGVVDYLVYGGVYRGVDLLVRQHSWLCAPRASSAWGAGRARLRVDARLGGDAGAAGLVARAALTQNDGSRSERSAALTSGQFQLDFGDLDGILPWDMDQPHLYRLEIELLDAEGNILDSLGCRIGFRDAEFRPEGFFLNGKKLFLKGLNRHQSWPYSGYAMGPGPQRRDAEILKRELGLDIVRTSHYPQSRHFLDACDELGLLVFEEVPGWQHVGGVEWKARSLLDLKAMIERDRNHPSIILWGVRINESQDDHEFYAAMNSAARELDPTRQTGGVRYIEKSELLEDVYTFNDFTNDGSGAAIAPPTRVAGAKVPYLITEHNGHMFPTKRFDQEERLAEHALRHADVMDASIAAGLAGAIGWCAFDYQTHKDFGSGDRVCYHGVSDMFRIPKPAAAMYASQAGDPGHPVLEPDTGFSKGERSAARLLPFHIYTNCDSVEVFRGGKKVGRFYPDRKRYPHLPHPPVLVDDFIGDLVDAENFPPRDKKTFLELAAKAMARGASGLSLVDKAKLGAFLLRRKLTIGDLQALVMRLGLGWGGKDERVDLVGYAGDKEIVRRSFGADGSARRLQLSPDAPGLHFERGGEWDSVGVRVTAVDQYGNPCPFLFEPIRIRVEGPGRLLGPAERSLAGGATAFWLASVGEPGEVRFSVECPRFETVTAHLPAEAVGG